MNDHYSYGFAALGSESVYPRFREGLKLDYIPVDFLLPEELGFQLMQFLEQTNQGWERASTASEMMIIDGLIATYTEPKTKIVNTYTSATRTPLVGDGLVMVMSTTCHVASAAVMKQLLDLAAKPPIPTDLLDWTAKHASLLQNAGCAVVTKLHTYEMRHVTEQPASPIRFLQRYL